MQWLTVRVPAAKGEESQQLYVIPGYKGIMSYGHIERKDHPRRCLHKLALDSQCPKITFGCWVEILYKDGDFPRASSRFDRVRGVEVPTFPLHQI